MHFEHWWYSVPLRVRWFLRRNRVEQELDEEFRFHLDHLIAQELAALEVVAVTEELTWGAIVEPALGPAATATLFAAKHVVIDSRWRRGIGLFAFWMGLAAQRRRWPLAAMLVHAALNAAGVVQGHVSSRDRF